MRFFRYTLILAAVTAFAGQGQQSAPDSTAGPRAEFGTTRFSFGEVHQGDRVTHSFVFKNVGAEKLVVKAVTPT